MSRRFKGNEENSKSNDDIKEKDIDQEGATETETSESRGRGTRKNGKKENKKLKLLGNIAYWILVLITLLILLVVAIQRFSNNKISLAGFKIFNVITGSMEPEYMIGDVLLSKERDINEIKIGDDVVYMGKEGDFKDRIVTHRVIEIKHDSGEPIFHTQGIATSEEDPPITGDQIMGVITYKIHSLSLLSKTMNNLYSFYFVVFLPMVVLIFIEGRKFFKKD